MMLGRAQNPSTWAGPSQASASPLDTHGAAVLGFRRPDTLGTARCAGGEDLKSVPAGLQEVCPLLEKTGAEGAVCSVLVKTGSRPGRRAESAPRRSGAGSDPRSAILGSASPLPERPPLFSREGQTRKTGPMRT